MLFVGMTVANVGNYTLNLVVGRLTSPADFSIFVSLVSLAAMLTMPVMALATVAAKFSATFAAADRQSAVRGLFRLLDRVALIAGIVVFILILVLAHPIERFLHLPTLVPLVVLAASFGLSLYLPVARGFLQGSQRFVVLSANTAIEPIIKIVVAVGLLWLGYGVSGAIGGYGVAFVGCYLLARWVLAASLRGTGEPIDWRTLWHYSAATLVSLVALSLLTSIDVILARHYFSATDAGLYAGLATVGKIILFVSAPLVAVMFPLIVTKLARGERHFHLLVQTLTITGALSLLVLIAFTARPDLAMQLLFGAKYAAIAPLLPAYGVAMLLLAIATVFVHYFLSIGFTRVSWLLLLALAVELVMTRVGALTPIQLVHVLQLVFLGLNGALGFTYLSVKRYQRQTHIHR